MTMGAVGIAIAASIAFGSVHALGGKASPPVTIGTANGQVFSGGANVALQPDSTPPVISAQAAVTDAMGGAFGDAVTSAEAIYGLAVPGPGLGMLAQATPVWAIIETDPCVPNLGPGEGSQHGPLCVVGGRAVVFVDASTGEILGQETIGQ
jgi:hypothetical protein